MTDKKAKRVPKEKPRCNGTMTESAYWSFIRSGLRQKSRRWRPIYDCLNASKRPSKSKTNKRLKWEYQCNVCGKWNAGSDTSVDHIIPCGSLRCADDLPGFVERLFCDSDNLQTICSTCHDAKTQEDRQTKNEIKGTPG